MRFRSATYVRFLGFSLFFLGCAMCFGTAARAQEVVSSHFPQRKDITILCWTDREPGTGFVSQIVIFQAGGSGNPKALWQSALDLSYAPKIRFVPEITAHGLALALVERQTGAGSSQLDVIANTGGGIKPVQRIDGFKFEIQRLADGKLPSIIAHTDASILDVPHIYDWNVTRFLDNSAAYPSYYRKLLVEDQRSLPADLSGVVAVNLSRIAVLSGDPKGAREILDDALARERSKRGAADRATILSIRQALNSLGNDVR